MQQQRARARASALERKHAETHTHAHKYKHVRKHNRKETNAVRQNIRSQKQAFAYTLARIQTQRTDDAEQGTCEIRKLNKARGFRVPARTDIHANRQTTHAHAHTQTEEAR